MAEITKLGRYELRRVLGKGAMGVVYEGFDPTLGRRVAVKTILKSVAHDEETQRDYAERFVREAKAVARLNHPNIIQVHDFGVEGDVAYLVMEFIQGRELRGYFDANEKFDAGEVVRIMSELLDALEFAHEANVIHRDVKPANVMLDAQRRVKLADFGVARVQDSDRSAAGTMVGTPAYMSPEQIQGQKVDRRTDIFSAGVVLYQLLTGEQPFKGEGAWTVAKQIMQDDPPAPSSVVRSVSPVLDAIVEKALAKNPAQRFANAREFVAALRELAIGRQPTIAPGTGEAEVEFWRSIQNSGEPSEFEFYLRRFPNGMYAEPARQKLAKLREPIDAARKSAEAARKAAEDAARREMEAKARREAEEEKTRQAQALADAARKFAEVARKAAENAARRDADATLAYGAAKPAVAAQAPAERKASFAIPLVAAVVAIAGAFGAYLFASRMPAPVADNTSTKSAVAPAPAVDTEKIRREIEERVRKEFAEKAAAERAAMEKAVMEKIAAERVAAERVTQAKTAAEKAAAEKAVAAASAERIAAQKAAAEKAALNKAAAEKAEAQRIAAEKVAMEKAITEKALAEKMAAERSAADKAAVEKAAVEKAAVEKAAVEKAAVEKAAVEKAAAEKIAVEKAAAEKVLAEKAAAEKAATKKLDVNSEEAKLERFIQRVGREKVLKQEPRNMFHGQVVYINDGSCGPGRIKEIIGEPTGMPAVVTIRGERQTRCIPLDSAAEKQATEKPASEKMAAEKLGTDRAAAEKLAAIGDEAKLARFIQRVGRDKVLKEEPERTSGVMFQGQVVYVNDGSCGPGRIKEVTGEPSGGRPIGAFYPYYVRPNRCIPLE